MKKWTDEMIIREIKRLSKNGYAPNPKECSSLYYVTQYKRKGWYYYCNLAGVKPRNKPRKKTKYTSNSKLKRPSNPYIKRLAYLLGIARKYGHTDGDTIMRCIYLVHTGALDNLFNMGEVKHEVGRDEWKKESEGEKK
ncbi:MAG: hypothetical protein GXW85_04800 [Clostridia bacterium]|nr:hypothetical protein [Clostridia bacterium]